MPDLEIFYDSLPKLTKFGTIPINNFASSKETTEIFEEAPRTEHSDFLDFLTESILMTTSISAGRLAAYLFDK